MIDPVVLRGHDFVKVTEVRLRCLAGVVGVGDATGCVCVYVCLCVYLFDIEVEEREGGNNEGEVDVYVRGLPCAGEGRRVARRRGRRMGRCRRRVMLLLVGGW